MFSQDNFMSRFSYTYFLFIIGYFLNGLWCFGLGPQVHNQEENSH